MTDVKSAHANGGLRPWIAMPRVITAPIKTMSITQAAKKANVTMDLVRDVRLIVTKYGAPISVAEIRLLQGEQPTHNGGTITHRAVNALVRAGEVKKIGKRRHTPLYVITPPTDNP